MNVFLMDLPKPLHGMSSVNRSVLHQYIANGRDCMVINSAPSYASFIYGERFWGIIKFAHSIACFFGLFFCLAFKSCNAVYRPINGGFGQVYDFLYISLCKVFNVKLIIHHHSFNYLNKTSRLFDYLQKLAGKDAVHVVLGSSMGEKLVELYGIKTCQIHVLSNVSFFEERNVKLDVTERSLTIGHLANLCIEKGVEEFINLCKELELEGQDYKAYIAGPYADSKSKDIVEKAIFDFPRIQYLGPLYGNKKDLFFQSLDVFVFPSHYSNEAEPLVLYEAAQFGVLNIGTRRGCMGPVIDSLGGLTFAEDEVLVRNMSESIVSVKRDGYLGIDARKERVNLFVGNKDKASKSLTELFELMAK